MKNLSILSFLVFSVIALGCGGDDSPQETAEPGASPDASQESVPDAQEPAPAAECVATLPDVWSLKLSTEGTRLYDVLGREVMLRGINTGGRSKVPPFFPFPYAESGFPGQEDSPSFMSALETYCDRLVEWGHNFARVPFSWEAVEPIRDEFDATFLESYTIFLDELNQRGIRAVVDFHQDVFARPLCGDGFPLWAVLSPITPKDPEDCEGWFTGYITPGDVQTAFDHFWANDDGLVDEFKDMWREMVKWTWSIDGVVGFEIINEPGWGSMDLEEFLTTVLPPFYNELIEVIREGATDSLVFFDATGLDAVEGKTALLRPEGEGLVFAPHFYDPNALLLGTWDGDDSAMGYIDNWREKGEEWNVPVLVGEFGMRATADNAPAYLRMNFDGLDASLLHGTAWEYSATVDDWNNEGISVFSHDEGELPTAAEVIRAYPAAIAGSLVSFSYDRESLQGTVVFEATADGISEIVVPTRLYPNGVQAVLEGVDGCTATVAGAQRLVVRTMTEGLATLTFLPAE